MSSNDEIKFKEILQLGKDIFINLDVRALICRKADTEPWNLGFVKILATNRSRAEIDSECDNILDDLQPEMNDTVELLHECIPYANISEFVDQLQSGRFSLRDKAILSCLNINFKDSQLTRYRTSYIQNPEYESNWTLYAPISSRTSYEVERLGYDPIKIGIDFSHLYKWFDIPKNDWESLFVSLIMLIPIQVKRISKNLLQNEIGHIQYVINKKFINEIKILITLESANRGPINIQENKGFRCSITEQNSKSILNINLDATLPQDIQSLEIKFSSLILDKILKRDKIRPEINLQNEIDVGGYHDYMEEYNGLTQSQNNMFISTNSMDIISGNINSNINTRPVDSPINVIQNNYGPELRGLVQDLINKIEQTHDENSEDLNNLKNELISELSKEKLDRSKAKQVLDAISNLGPFATLVTQIMSRLS